MCYEDCDGPEPYENDLETWGENEAWEDSQAEKREGSEPIRATVTITPYEAEEANRLLSLEEADPDSKECSTLMEWTATFPNGFQADIKVCNGDCGPWVDAVLFCENGSELGVCEPGEGPIEGEFHFEENGDTYVVTVEIAQAA